MKLILGTLAAAAAVPALLAVVSFIAWENGLRTLGWKFILRGSLVVVAAFWVMVWMSAGGA